jgi:hypothetical protein
MVTMEGIFELKLVAVAGVYNCAFGLGLECRRLRDNWGFG